MMSGFVNECINFISKVANYCQESGGPQSSHDALLVNW